MTGNDSPPSSNRRVSVRSVFRIAGLVVVVLGVYVAGYLSLPDREPAFGRMRSRAFPTEGLATAYWPAAWVEAKWSGHQVVIWTAGDWSTISVCDP